MNTYTVAFFGHRQIDNFDATERKMSELIKRLVLQYEYVEFLVGKNGEFDQMASSVIRRIKHLVRDDNNTLTLILPYSAMKYVAQKPYKPLICDTLMMQKKTAKHIVFGFSD